MPDILIFNQSNAEFQEKILDLSSKQDTKSNVLKMAKSRGSLKAKTHKAFDIWL